MLKFKQYLNEAFDPNFKFEWGSNAEDYNDHDFYNNQLAVLRAWFYQGDKLYRVDMPEWIDNHYGGYGSIYELNFDNQNPNNRKFQQVPVGNEIFEILNKVFVIGKTAYDRYSSITGFLISGWTEELDNVYKKIIDSKQFQKMLKDMDFKVIEDEAGYILIGNDYLP